MNKTAYDFNEINILNFTEVLSSHKRLLIKHGKTDERIITQ